MFMRSLCRLCGPITGGSTAATIQSTTSTASPHTTTSSQSPSATVEAPQPRVFATIDPVISDKERRAAQFSFIARTNDRAASNRLAILHSDRSVVPNNDAPIKLPMWSSSLTSPKMELQRLRVDSWIAPHLSAGFHKDEDVDLFVEWLTQRADAAAAADSQDGSSSESSSYLSYALREHVQFKVRAGGSCRGIFARRAFQAGDVILDMPAAVGSRRKGGTSSGSKRTSSGEDPLWGLHLNSDTLKRYSRHAERRYVLEYDDVWEIVSKRFTSLDPYVHPLFVDQIYSALFLACEKEAGEDSELYPYLRLLPDPAVEDDLMLEIHRGVLTPSSHLEYHEHVNRLHLWIGKVHTLWAERIAAKQEEEIASSLGTGSTSTSSTAPTVPPSKETLMWAMRTMISRQLTLPNYRPKDSFMTDRLMKDTTMEHILDRENFWMRNVTRVRHWWLRHVFRVVDEERLAQFEFQATTIATLSPVMAMLQHDTRGGNVSWEVEQDQDGSSFSSESKSADAPGASSPSPLLLVATKDIKAGQELTRSFRRCYSTSYALFRYGFVPLNDREADTCSDLLDAGFDAKQIGWDREDINMPRLNKLLKAKDGDSERTEALQRPKRKRMAIAAE